MHQSPRARSLGFSLIELSIVVAIISVVVVLGLEAATQFVGSRAYDTTQAQLVTLDKALDNFYKANGRLPCPAVQTAGTLSTNYAAEDCANTSWSGTGAGIMSGTVPTRTLGMPVSAGIDPWGDKIGYWVTYNVAIDSTTANNGSGVGLIVIRSGNFTSFSTLATDAAYVMVSHGADRRGAFTKMGVATSLACGTSDTRIDAQNCVYSYGGTTSPTINANVFYDSRYNNGNVTANYFDDVVIWRQRGQL